MCPPLGQRPAVLNHLLLLRSRWAISAGGPARGAADRALGVGAVGRAGGDERARLGAWRLGVPRQDTALWRSLIKRPRQCRTLRLKDGKLALAWSRARGGEFPWTGTRTGRHRPLAARRLGEDRFRGGRGSPRGLVRASPPRGQPHGRCRTTARRPGTLRSRRPRWPGRCRCAARARGGRPPIGQRDAQPTGHLPAGRQVRGRASTMTASLGALFMGRGSGRFTAASRCGPIDVLAGSQTVPHRAALPAGPPSVKHQSGLVCRRSSAQWNAEDLQR
jgi:hypothetical protein